MLLKKLSFMMVRARRNVVAALTALALAAATPLPAFAWSEAWVYSFTGGNDGANPIAGLAVDPTGTTLYGAAVLGGAYGQGTLFSLSTNGGQPSILHAFNSGAGDGSGPSGTPFLDTTSGRLIGSTTYASYDNQHGSQGFGTVYSYQLATAGYSVLHRFTGGYDGGNPFAGLTNCNGVLYGTTSNGSMIYRVDPYGFSTVGSVASAGGQYLFAPVICDDDGNVYGTAVLGGSGYNGIAFEMTPSGHVTQLYSLDGGIYGGAYPQGGLYTSDGTITLIGTTSIGGRNRSNGVIYKLTYAGLGRYSYRTIYDFGATATDGTDPYAGVVEDKSHNLFGTTTSGGAAGAGTVYELVLQSAGVYTYKQIYAFKGGNDGSMPYAALVVDSNGNLYGSTRYGGSYGKGTIFKLTQ